MKRNYARERSEIHRKARPLGDFIAQAARAKAQGLPIPPVPAVRPPAQPRPSAGSSREAPVLRACLQWLRKHGVFAWRNNSGMLWANGQPVAFGYPGSADILGLLPDGRFLAVECKSEKGRQSPLQKTFEENIKRNNGVYVLAYSAADLEVALRIVNSESS